MDAKIRRIIAFLVINFSINNDIKCIYDDDFQYYDFEKLPLLFLQIKSIYDEEIVIFSERKKEKLGSQITVFSSYFYKPEIKVILDKSHNNFQGSVDSDNFTGTISKNLICLHENNEDYYFGI